MSNQSYKTQPNAADERYRDMVAAVVEAEPIGTRFRKDWIAQETGLSLAQVNRGIHYYRNLLAAAQDTAFVQLGSWEYYLTSDPDEVAAYNTNHLRRTLTLFNTLSNMLTAVSHGRTEGAKAARSGLKDLGRLREDVADALNP